MRNIDLSAELILQVVSHVPERKCALSYMHMLPVIVSQVIYLSKLLVVRKVNNFRDSKANIILVFNVEDFLLVIHDVQGLRHDFINIILYVLSISLKRGEPAPCKLENLLFRNLIF